jgi:starvation-inducible DNA-binding protein
MTDKTTNAGHHPTLGDAERRLIGEELQGVLVTLTDLSLAGKQAHWNLMGPLFRPLHLFLDELIESWRNGADEVAERAVALGYPPDGRAGTVAQSSILAPLPEGRLLDVDVIAAFTGLLTTAIGDARARMDRLEDVDAVTADLLHGIVLGLEENLWMISAHSPDQ